jgi:hypothetical protein
VADADRKLPGDISHLQRLIGKKRCCSRHATGTTAAVADTSEARLASGSDRVRQLARSVRSARSPEWFTPEDIDEAAAALTAFIAAIAT